MRDIVIYRDIVNHQAPLGVILDKQFGGSHGDGNSTTLVSDKGTSHTVKATRNSDIADSSVPAPELPRGLLEMNIDGQIVQVSISHDKDYAMATAIVPHS